MTNFEKWRSKLTVEDFVVNGHKDIIFSFLCNMCPAKNYCDSTPENELGGCADILRQWAKQESVDE
jgi:hypothetical protein